MTQQQLARAVGMPQPSIARIERGAVVPRTVTLIAMLEATGHELAVEQRSHDVDIDQIRRQLALSTPMRVRRSLERAGRDPSSSPTLILRRLRRFGVPFVLVGDMAEVAHGSPTKLGKMVEVCHARTDVAKGRLAAALEDLREKSATGSLRLLTETPAGDDYEMLVRTAVPMYPDAGLRVSVASIEDLVRSRLVSGTPADQTQAAVLRAVIGLSGDSTMPA